MTQYNHGEAFMLMQYSCQKLRCGHYEIIWNSRDGVTPFAAQCPSCGQPSLQHVNWRGDVRAPEHKLHKWQRFWRDGTSAEAVAIIQRRIDRMKPPHDIAQRLLHGAHNGEDEWRAGWPMLDINLGDK